MKKLQKKIAALILLVVLTVNIAVQDYTEAQAAAAAAGAYVIGDVLLSVLISGLALTGVYELFDKDDAESYGVNKYTDLTADQKAEHNKKTLEDCKGQLSGIAESTTDASFAELIRSALNGVNGTSALKNFESTLDEENKTKSFGSNKKPDDDGNVSPDLAVTAGFMNEINRKLAEGAREHLLKQYSNLPPFPDEVANYSHYRVLWSTSGTIQLHLYNPNPNKFYGIIPMSSHASLHKGACEMYETWFTSYKEYTLKNNNWILRNSLSNTGIGFCDFFWRFLYLNHDLLYQNGDTYLNANPYPYRTESDDDDTNNDPVPAPAPSQMPTSAGGLNYNLDSAVPLPDDEKYIIPDNPLTVLDAMNNAASENNPDEDEENFPVVMPSVMGGLTESIYPSLDPAEQLEFNQPVNNVPTSGLNDYDSPGLDDRFPFCIPFDLIALIGVFAADPVTPHVEIPFTFERLGIDEKIVIDLSDFENVAEICRWIERIGFIGFLIIKTRDLIRG